MKKLLCIAVLLLLNGCTGYVFTVSVPMVFDANDFQYLKVGQLFEVPKSGSFDEKDDTDGYYFSNEALKIYIASKITEYEVRWRGFWPKESEK